jgi:hypothetical protein
LASGFKNIPSLLLATTLLLLHGPEILTAQITHSTGDADNYSHPAFGLTATYSPHSFKAWGKMQNTQQSQLHMNFRHSRIPIGEISISVATDLILTGWVRYPIDGVDGPRESAVGLGIIPLRFQVPFSNRGNGLFFTASGGFLVFGSKFPSGMGARFNYLLDSGIGYQFQLKNGRILQAGYKLNHLSNGNSGDQNPGIDSQNIFFSILFNL